MICTPKSCNRALTRKKISKSPRMIPQLMILAFSLDEKRLFVSSILIVKKESELSDSDSETLPFLSRKHTPNQYFEMEVAN